MREKWVHLGPLHLEEENLSSDFSENFDFTRISLSHHWFTFVQLFYSRVIREV